MLHWLTMNILNIRACRVKVNICCQTKLIYFYRINAVCVFLIRVFSAVSKWSAIANRNNRDRRTMKADKMN